MLIRSASGIRGIAENDFSPEIIDKYISAFVFSQKIKNCVIGKDGRPSGDDMVNWAIDSLVKRGVNVDNCGLATTPTVQIIAENKKYDGGIIITASHNPSEYNGIKFLQPDGTFLSPQQCENLFLLSDQDYTSIDLVKSGKVQEYKSADLEHINTVLKLDYVNLHAIQSKKFKVVIDAVNGAGSKILPQLCKKLGCKVIKINCKGDGEFKRIPEPLAKNLKHLEEKVLETNADIGFATDPDGDRLSIVSNSGRAIGEEYTLVLAYKNYLNYKKTPIVTNLSTSMMIDSFGEKSIRTKIGEAHVVSKMKELEIEIGGEGNGGVIAKQVHLGRDSLVAIAMVLSLLSSANQTLDEIISSIPSYIFLKDQINIRDNISFDELETVFDCDEIIKLDGIKFVWQNKWIHIRKSNTEPIIRIFAEAPTNQEANELIDRLKKYLNETTR